MLHIGCRPRGFSPPRRFGFQPRSGNVAPQPDRIRTVSGSREAVSNPDSLDPTTEDLLPGPFTTPALTGPSRTHSPHGEQRVPYIQSTGAPKNPLVLDRCPRAAIPGTHAPLEEHHSRTVDPASLRDPHPRAVARPAARATCRPRPRGSLRKTDPRTPVARSTPETFSSMGF